MTVYFVDDGGSATAPYDTWAKAATSLSALDDAVSFASGDIVYIGHDHVCQYVHAANRDFIGPTLGVPTIVISATAGSDPPAYAQSVTNQIDTTEGAYRLAWDGSFAVYGVRMIAGSDCQLFCSQNEGSRFTSCTFAPAANGRVGIGYGLGSGAYLDTCVIDLSADGTTPRSSPVIYGGPPNASLWARGLTFVNAGYRTGSVFDLQSGGVWSFTGCDFSGFTNATTCEIVGAMIGCHAHFSHCLMAATWVPISAAALYPTEGGELIFVNCGPADSPTYLYDRRQTGLVVSSSDIYRTGGGTVENIACSWLITTTAYCVESRSFHAPWMYGTVEAGARTFDVYITNDTADFTDAEVWLEVEYLSTADEPQWELASDQRATITATAAAQADDTSSTWNGSGPSFTYKQKLSVAATVGESGQYRARVVVGKASIASSRYFYVDPLVTVT